MTITRTLATALATAALAAPAASAQPADMHASTAQAAAKSQQKQDLRSEAARDASNARGATAVDSRSVPGPPTWPAHPQPITSAPAVEAPGSGGGIDWTMIGSGLAVSVLAVGGIAALAGRSRRIQRTRVSA